MNCAPTVSEIIDQQPMGRYQIWTMALCGMVIVLDGFDTQSIGFLAPSMAETLRIPIKNFAPIFVAALIGLMFSSMLSGPIADRWGRKGPIVTCTLIFGMFAMLTPQCTSLHQLVACRLLTGLGLGGALSNSVALMSEYAPKRLLAVIVSMMFCGMPTGAVLATQVSAVMLPRWGWQSVFYAGGILPLTLALLLIAILPESVRYLEVSGANEGKISRILARISPALANEPISRSEHQDQRRKAPVMNLFTEGRAAGTILLWIPYFMNLLMLYFVVFWLPALLRQTGKPVSAGITAIMLFSVGGIAGSFVEGAFMNRWGAFTVLLTEFLCTTLLIASLAYSSSFPLMMTITFVLGFVVQGAQGGLSAVAATFYPISIRSTGIGWCLGVGRIGSIVGPILGGVMLKLDWSPREILLAGSIPALCAAAATFLSLRLRSNLPAEQQKAGLAEQSPVFH
ncbi:MAG TPA: MFS transporter [Candidatus Acidoferrales bacterium]|jgi:AAHS family 4-hydroxybenzoate transporter-like MFS transporter|nr:MFS transporter [Candidatus Acidoferrales bacterium]